MTDESRILAVLDPVKQRNQLQVIRLARMGSPHAVGALARLVDLGLVEESTYRSGRQGRPAYLYRLIDRKRQTQEPAV